MAAGARPKASNPGASLRPLLREAVQAQYRDRADMAAATFHQDCRLDGLPDGQLPECLTWCRPVSRSAGVQFDDSGNVAPVLHTIGQHHVRPMAPSGQNLIAALGA